MSIPFSRTFTAAAAVAVFSFACGSEPATEPRATIQAPLASVEVQTIPRLQPFAATIRAESIATLSSRIPGDIVAVHVQAGDRVSRGQLLVEIDDRDAGSQVARALAEQRSTASAIESATAAVRSAEAHASLAEATWQRFRPLRDRGSVSPQEYDEVESRHRSASAELERSRQSLAQLTAQRDAVAAALRQAQTFSSYTRIVAPFDGVISSRFADEGTQAAPGAPLLTIDGGSGYRAEATIDEGTPVAAGDQIIVESAGTSIRARISQVVPSVDPATRTSLIKIELPPTTAWRSGAFARVHLPIGQHQAITIPASAVVRRGQLTTVYAVRGDGTAQLRLITIAGAAGDRVEVLSGLAAGERIIAQPPAAMREGVLVKETGA